MPTRLPAGFDISFLPSLSALPAGELDDGAAVVTNCPDCRLLCDPRIRRAAERDDMRITHACDIAVEDEGGGLHWRSTMALAYGLCTKTCARCGYAIHVAGESAETNVSPYHMMHAAARRLRAHETLCIVCARAGDVPSCADCGRWLPNENDEVSDDDDIVCAACYNGRHEDDDEGSEDEDTAGAVTTVSGRVVSVPRDGVASHDFRPQTELKHVGAADKLRGRYLGIEVEAENCSRSGTMRSEGHDVVRQTDGHFFVKHDGSISYGFEMVSHPATIEWWRQHTFSHFGVMAKRGWRSYYTTTCGMHVHVSRATLSPASILKLLTFMRENQHFVLGVSRRVPSRLEQWAAPDCDYTKNLVRKAKDHRLSGNRYVALNTTNRATVEFRIFRGTLHGPAIMRNLELVSALCAFAEGAGLRDMTDAAFVAWLQTKAGASIVTPKVSRELLEWVVPMVPKTARLSLSGRILSTCDMAPLMVSSYRQPENAGVMPGEETQ